MKLVLDEKVKLRLIGLAVIVSVAAIFLPAMMKASNHRLEDTMNISVRLPDKPALPQVSEATEKEVFETVKVAHVELNMPPETPRANQLAAERISDELAPTEEMAMADAIVGESSLPPAPKLDSKVVPKAAPVARAPAPKRVVSVPARQPQTARAKPASKAAYGVQLALFSKQDNARRLVGQLQTKGYSARIHPVRTASGMRYRVIVGALADRGEALRLRTRLASNMQMNGFVVNTGVA